VSWERYRLKHLARINARAVSEDTPEDLEFRYIDISTVGRGRLVAEPQRLRFGEAPSRARRLVRTGDTIISTVRTYLRAVYPITENVSDLVVSTGFAVISPGELVDPRFLAWWSQSDACVEEVVALSVGVSYPAVNASELGDLEVRLPSLSEQREIAGFLEAETARIDALIEKKQRVVALLEERRTALTIAGAMNSAWPRVKLTLLARLGSGHTPSRSRPEWWDDPTIPWITTGDIAQMRGDRIEFIQSTRFSISELGLANSAAELHPAETVVLSRTASVGFSAIMARAMSTSQDFATWTCGPRLRPQFLLLCLRAMRSELLDRLAMGSTHKTIYMPDIESIRVPLPSLDEQDQVVSDVWARLRPIDRVVDAIDRQVALLRERRQALITAAVTGQLDVSKAAP
jgi:type I restriction enzyme S subunit